MDDDEEGDVCDLDDGLIYLDVIDPTTVDYPLEIGFAAFHVYRGDLGILRTYEIYTQDPSQLAAAARFCFQTAGPLVDPFIPSLGGAVFYLAEGAGGTLGEDSAGNPRPNHNPCP